jgi:molybdopterin converting factor small subunit
MHISIKFFGQLSEIVGYEIITIENIPSNLNTILNDLYSKSPLLEEHLFAVFVNNKKIDNTDVELNHNDEVCLMPPFAGG